LVEGKKDTDRPVKAELVATSFFFSVAVPS
jgi:hypothetical protein